MKFTINLEHIVDKTEKNECLMNELETGNSTARSSTSEQANKEAQASGLGQQNFVYPVIRSEFNLIEGAI